MKRREFITLLGGAVIASSLTARAQQSGTLYRIALFSPGTAGATPELRGAFIEALRDLGWIEGKNVIYEARYAENRLDRLPELVAELLRLNVDVILTAGTPGIRAAKNATTRFLSSW